MKMTHRETTRTVAIGSVKIGGGNEIAIQSMTNTDTADVSATVKQILDLEAAGCSYTLHCKYYGGGVCL